MTVSAGIASLMPTVRQQPESLLRGAERALERAGSGHGGRVALAGAKDFE